VVSQSTLTKTQPVNGASMATFETHLPTMTSQK
jgi:hypothetical protein